MEPWIGEAVGKMHIHKIKQMQVAAIMGVTNDYISMILNGKKSPKNAEARIKAAIDEIINERKENSA